MPKIELSHVTKRWGGFYAVEDLNLVIENNSFVTLLGPSGCGKTTTLRMIAGLETPTSGKITIGDTVVFDSEKGINIPASKRKVGFLFQNYALWPNMTVYQNIAFGLKNIKEEMPVYDFSHKTNNQLINALRNPKKYLELIEDCKDKNGKIITDRVLIKFIANYTISIYTAKKLLSYKLHECENVNEVANGIIEKLTIENETIENSYKAKNLSLNSESIILENDKPVLKVRKLDKEEVDLSVRKVSKIVKVEMFMDRYPAELSGGQQQRVAIARTLAPGPSVLFMDEPLSNLDAKLRLEMRYELQRLHVETGSTFVYVTHDQMEAMTLATKICLIDNGLLQQYQAPLDVYNFPNNTFVADFVGNPSINFVEAKGKQNDDGTISLEFLDNIKAKFKPNNLKSLDEWYMLRDKELENKAKEKVEKQSQKNYVEKANKDELFKYKISRVKEIDEALEKDYTPVNGDFVLGIRPEFIRIDSDGKINAEIHGAMPTGMESTLKLKVGEYLLTSVVFGNTYYPIGKQVKLSFASNTLCLFDRVSGRIIDNGEIELM